MPFAFAVFEFDVLSFARDFLLGCGAVCAASAAALVGKVSENEPCIL